MKLPREIYRKLCESNNLDAAVSRLSCDDLAAVAQYIAKLKPSGGLPSQVWGSVQQALDSKRITS